MATRPNPYLKKDPGDIMLASDWNDMQVLTREELHGHGHTGGADAPLIGRTSIAPAAIDGSLIDPQADVALKSLKVNSRVLLDELDKLLASVTQLGTTKLDRAGDTVVGGLKIGGALGLANSDLYFSRIDHKHSGAGNATGNAAIENAVDYDALMILGRSGAKHPRTGTPTRLVRLWDFLQVEGELKVTGLGQFAGDLSVGGNLQGNSIELGASNSTPGTGTPYIDFHLYGKTEDYNARIINDGDGLLSVYCKSLSIGGVTATAGLTVAGDLAVHGKAIRLGIDGNGGGQLIICNNPNDNRIYLEAFNQAGNDSATEMLLTGANSSSLPKLSFVASNTSATGSFSVGEAIKPSAGNAENRGIMFPKDPGSGSGDAAWIRYYPRAGEACSLELGVSDNVDDYIYFNSSGGVQSRGVFKTDALRLGDKFKLSGVGDGQANDDWLRLTDVNAGSTYYGGFAAGRLWTAQGSLNGSDQRLKHAITAIDQAISKVNALRGVTFLWNDAPDTSEQAGVIAQEVEAVFPQVVTTGPDGFKGVNYNGLIGLLIEAIKEQQTMIDSLKNAITPQPI